MDLIERLRAITVYSDFALRATAEVEAAHVRLDQGRFEEAARTLDTALDVRSDGPLGPLVVGRVDAAAFGPVPGAW